MKAKSAKTRSKSPPNGVAAIDAAKTRMREAYRNGDVQGVLSAFAESRTDFSDGFPSFYDPDSHTVLRARLEKLFREYHVDFSPIVVDVAVAGSLAVEHGLHQFTLRPKAGGPPVVKKTRYVEAWRCERDGKWRIFLYIDNADQEPQLPEDLIAGLLAHAKS